MKHPLGYIFLLLVILLIGGCSIQRDIRKTEQIFQRGEYFEASKRYRKIYSIIPSSRKHLRGRIGFKIGESYRLCNIPAKAESGYRNAVKYLYGDSILTLRYAQILVQNGKLKEAEKQFQTYLSFNPNDPTAKNGLASLQEILYLKANPTRYKVKRNSFFNGRKGDFCPMYGGSKENDIVYFTTSRDDVIGKKTSKITGIKNNDIFVCSKNEKGRWDKPASIEGEINSSYDEGSPTFAEEGRALYFTRCESSETFDKNAEIYTSQRSGSQWSNPIRLFPLPDSTAMVAHPVVTPDDAFLYFVSDIPGGYGGKDIWRVSKKNLEFGEPENLGPAINTAGNEMFPYFRSDGTFYFASDGHPGLGGLDIFKVRIDPFWGPIAENMGIPINSPGDDFGITFASKGEQGLLSSNRSDARGYDHIYEFICPEIITKIEGRVIQYAEEFIDGVFIRVVGNKGTNQKATPKRDGTYSVSVQPGERYALQAYGKGYLNNFQEVYTDSVEESRTYNVDFSLHSIQKPVPIDNIFFDFGQATLTPESSVALDQLIKVLKDNNNITIELGAHTDMIGSDVSNDILSQRRAQAVVDYLIAGGIEKARMTAKGYGEKQPLVPTAETAKRYPYLKEGAPLDELTVMKLIPAQREIANRLNRRTEFRVTSTTYKLY